MQKKYNLNPSQPFYLLKKSEESRILLCLGQIKRFEKIKKIPLKKEKPLDKTFDSVSLIPFSQAKERGFAVHDNNELISTLLIEEFQYIELEEFIKDIANIEVKLDNLNFETSEIEYENIVRQIIQNEIGEGQGANFVVSRKFNANINGDVFASVLSIFRSLLVNEIGSYATFVFYDGQNFVVGASPERHISKEKNQVMMNPISGTFRKYESNEQNFAQNFANFLSDKKEIFELFMVTDEELKIMCELCSQGGSITGPLLKEMSKVIHTEYLLLGNSDKSIHDLLINSMFAPTVTGSPVQSAFKIIKRYENKSRGQYGAVIALIGRDEEGLDILDAPITIRTLEITNDGNVSGGVGATLVRGSDPKSEVKETTAKIAGVLSSINATGKVINKPKPMLQNLPPENLQTILQSRNSYLSRFWIEDQSDNYVKILQLKNKKVTIIDAEDSFSNMLKMMISKMGADVKLVSFDQYQDDGADIVIPGPGPGNPVDKNDPKMVIMHKIINDLYQNNRKFFAVCLSHQILCNILGFSISKKEDPMQGVQVEIDFFGKNEKVGFYNTFAGIVNKNIDGVEISFDAKTKEIHALQGKNFSSVQFHAESILTPNGYNIIKNILLNLM